MLLLSLLSGATQNWIVRAFARHDRWINLAGGILMVGVGLYDLANNWDLIQTYLKIGFG